MPGHEQDDADDFDAAKTTFGHRVRTAREASGRSLEALAEHSALHWSYVSRVERGQGNVTLRSLLRLSSALDMDPGDLVRGLRLNDDE